MSETRPPMTAGPISRALSVLKAPGAISADGVGAGEGEADRRPWAETGTDTARAESTKKVAVRIMRRSLFQQRLDRLPQALPFVQGLRVLEGRLRVRDDPAAGPGT